MKEATIDIAMIERDPQQPRKLFDEAELVALAENMKSVGQQVPVIVYAVPMPIKYPLVDGERRWRAAKLAGITKLSAVILPGRPSAAELAVLQASIDAHRASLTPMERSNLLAKIKKEQGWNVSDLAQHLSMKQSLVSKLLSFQKLSPEVQDALHTGKLDMEKGFILSQKDETEQRILLESATALSRDQLRAKAKGKIEQPTRLRAVFNLGDGAMVSLHHVGQVTLSEAIKCLAAAVKELKKAHGQGLDITTVQSVMRDKAKGAV